MKLLQLISLSLALVSSISFGKGNEKNYSFNKAKRHLLEVYKDHQQTFYCGCNYNVKTIDYKACSYKPKNPKSKRANRIEWEHIVPAHDFGRSFAEWREGHKECVDNKKKKFKGRNCARKMNKQFRLMESDMYNLVPAIGEVNAIRSNHPISVTPLNKSEIAGSCATKISDNSIEPADQIKGFVARVYKYMHDAYPGHGIISKKNQKLFDAWDKMYPPSAWEIERAKRIEKIQGNVNQFVLASKGTAANK